MRKREMAGHYILYQDVEDFSRLGFMMISIPEGRVIEEKIIRGWREKPPIYVRWYHQQFGQNTLHLLTYMHTELTDLQVRAILFKAARFAWSNMENLDI
jgi:hypothetical protein